MICIGPTWSHHCIRMELSTVIQQFGSVRHLLIDADDTLWENNIYFERATEAFIEFLGHSYLSK